MSWANEILKRSGIYARTWMDRYEKSGDVEDLKQSRDLYVEAFDGAQDDYYTGINAAAKSVFLGTDLDLKRAAKYAERVQQIVGTHPHPNDYCCRNLPDSETVCPGRCPL
jgi:hypothetical protein